MWDSMPGHVGVMGGGWLFGLLFWILLVVLVIAFFRWIFSRENSSFTAASAEEILKRRYAAGEISEDDYLRMKKQLEGGGEG